MKRLFAEGPVESGVICAERFDAATRSEIERAIHEHILDAVGALPYT